MKSEKDLEKQAQRGIRAEQLIKDPLVSGALKNMRETCLHNIETSHFKSVDEREDLYKMLKAITAFEREFQLVMADGKKAEASLGDKIKNVLSIA